jgi:hypothetical protein
LSIEEDYEERIPHWSEKGGVRNLMFENLVPQPKAQGWICSKCDMQTMNLLPVNKRLPAEYWICTKCQRQISIVERDQVYDVIRQSVADKYSLEVFNYNKEKKTWDIQSAEWIGQSRIGAKQRQIKPSEREEIIDQLLNTLEDTLFIHFDTIRDYFLES